jgi:acyl dehydratase
VADDESLITDEHRALIGQPGEPHTVMVHEEDAHRMRDVLGDTDPHYADATGLAAPYVLAILQQDRGGNLQILPQGILTQQEWRYSRPLRIGETLTVTSQIVDIRERMGGRYGHSILVTRSTDLVDAEGKHVASALATQTQFDPARAQGRAE